MTDRVDRLALVIRGEPYHGRAPRSDLDIALAALALDREVEIHLLGPAVLQLASKRRTAAAGLSPGYRGWAALTDLGGVTLYAENTWVRRCEQSGIDLLMPVAGLSPAELSKRWRRCRHVIVV